VSQSTRPSQAATCTEGKLRCLSSLPYEMGDPRYFPPGQQALVEQYRPYREKYCDFYWEQCMKTGWSAYLPLSASHGAERR
jgi:hypothetical protein